MRILLLILSLFFVIFSSFAQHDHSDHKLTPGNRQADSAQAYIPGPRRFVASTGHSVVYHLTVSDTIVNFAGKKMPALATNGQIPAPVLRFTEGDTAVIYLHNRTKKTVSFHWHGILLPNRFDGVPLLTTELINPGETHLFKFKIIQNGTYWYHSHTGLDEQKGQYGPIVILPQGGIATKDKVIHLSDWVNEKPWEVLRTLKRHNEWYAVKRNAIQSYGRAITKGYLGTKLWMEWKRMPDMDLADVYYQAFLANGQVSENAPDYLPGERVRLRVINGSASSTFWFQFAGGKMTVVAADGLEVTPIEVDKVFIATAETYDVEITIPLSGKYEFRSTSWDASGHSSVWFGQGEAHPAPALPQPDYFKLAGDMREMSRKMNMTMGKAPPTIPEIKVMPPGEAPKPKMKMDMKNMDMNKNGMDEKGMEKMETGKLKPADQPAKKEHNHQQGMDHSTMEMPMAKDTSIRREPLSDSVRTKGKTYQAAELSQEGMQMGGMNQTMDGMDMGPLGTTMTGYKQVQAAFPNEILLNYDRLRALEPTILPESNPTRIVHLYLTGNMFRYVWSINNKTLSAADRIQVKKGENVRFVMHNTTMMSHPMHLHGHFFRVVNKQGSFSPLKHTVNVAPMEMVTLEFEATEEKDWFFHCHLLYHMMSGMARVVHYEGTDTPVNDAGKFKKFVSDDRAYFPFGELMLQSNGLWANFNVHNTKWLYNVEAEADWKGTYKAEPRIQRFFGPKQFFAAYVGGEISREEKQRSGSEMVTSKKDQLATLGVRAFLPMHFWGDLRIDHNGDFQVKLERHEISLTQRWRIGGMVEYNLKSDWEYTINTFYVTSKYTAISANYDNKYGFGAGILIVY